MAFVPDAKQRTEEGAQKHGYRLEDLERAEEKAKHARAMGWRSRRWLWAIIALVVVVAVLFVIFQITGPSDAVLPTP